MPSSYDWLATGGAYWVIAGAWITSSVFFFCLSTLTGKKAKSQNDGCLLAICTVILAVTGGGIGLYLGLTFTHYPTFVLTSILGCVLVPWGGSLVLSSRLGSRGASRKNRWR